MTLHSLTHFSLMYVCVRVCARFFAKKKKIGKLVKLVMCDFWPVMVFTFDLCTIQTC